MPTDAALRAAERACAEAMAKDMLLCLATSDGEHMWAWTKPASKYWEPGEAPPFASDPAACARLIEWAREQRLGLRIEVNPGDGGDYAAAEGMADDRYAEAQDKNWKAATVLAVAAAVREEGEAS